MRAALSAALAVLIVCGTARAADDLVFDIHNDTASDAPVFLYSPAGRNEWRDDIFGRGYIQAYSSATARVSRDDDAQCLFDFRYEFTDGSRHLRESLDLCTIEVYTMRGIRGF